MVPLLKTLLPIIKAVPAHHLGVGTIKIALIFMFTIAPIIAPIVLFQMLLMVYSGLSFQFLYETRIIKAAQPTPAKRPPQKRKPQPTSPKRERKPKQSDTP